MVTVLAGGVGQRKPGAAAFGAWDPNNKSTVATLFTQNAANDGLSSNASGIAGAATGATQRSSGKYYFELTCLNVPMVFFSMYSGGVVQAPWTPVNDIIGGSYDDPANVAIVLNVSGYWALQQAGVASGAPWQNAPSAGDVLRIAVDFNYAGTGYTIAYLGVNASWYNNGNFAQTLDVEQPAALLTAPLRPAGSSVSGQGLVINTGGSAWVFGPPATFLPWG